MVERGLLIWQGTFVRLTRCGMLLSNEVFQKFVNYNSATGCALCGSCGSSRRVIAFHGYVY
jgi:hypothetical protein